MLRAENQLKKKNAEFIQDGYELILDLYAFFSTILPNEGERP